MDGAFTSLSFGDAQTVAAGADSDPYHFAMLDSDSESGTDHAVYRQYSSTDGSWMSPDPYMGSYDTSNPQSFNRYVYASNRPNSRIDPLGYDDSDALCDSDLGCGAGDLDDGVDDEFASIGGYFWIGEDGYGDDDDDIQGTFHMTVTVTLYGMGDIAYAYSPIILLVPSTQTSTTFVGGGGASAPNNTPQQKTPDVRCVGGGGCFDFNNPPPLPKCSAVADLSTAYSRQGYASGAYSLASLFYANLPGAFIASLHSGATLIASGVTDGMATFHIGCTP